MVEQKFLKIKHTRSKNIARRKILEAKNFQKSIIKEKAFKRSVVGAGKTSKIKHTGRKKLSRRSIHEAKSFQKGELYSEQKAFKTKHTRNKKFLRKSITKEKALKKKPNWLMKKFLILKAKSFKVETYSK